MGENDTYSLPSDSAAIDQGCYYDISAAARACSFIERFLIIPKGLKAGQPFILMPWQRRVISTIFGWKTSEGIRRFRKAYIEIPKKNGKSPLAAAIALYMLIADGEVGAEVYLAANNRKQAGVVYELASSMVKSSPQLVRKCKPLDSKKTIEFAKNNSRLVALSADGPDNEGINASCIIYDETHSYKNRKLWDSLYHATAARRQPLQLAITTAGVYNPTGLGWTEHEHAAKIISGEEKDISYFAVIFTAPKDATLEDPNVWADCNPSLGIALTQEALQIAWNDAKGRPREEALFRRYRLNQWTATAEVWITPEHFAACSGNVMPAEIAKRNLKKPSIVALDLGKRSDMSAATSFFPTCTDSWDIIADFWLPNDNIVKKEQVDGAAYTQWAREGYLTLCPGDITDYESIAKRLVQLNELYDVKAIVADRAYLKFLLPLFETYAIGKVILDKFVEYPQNILHMSAPTKRWEELILARKITHGNNPILVWQNNNVALREQGDLIMPSKSRSVKRIDGIVAAVMGLGYLMLNNIREQKKKVYFVGAD